jgi:Ran GTPase-activating protein (RanGAP) involved in mRNA processing and transport
MSSSADTLERLDEVMKKDLVTEAEGAEVVTEDGEKDEDDDKTEEDEDVKDEESAVSK